MGAKALSGDFIGRFREIISDPLNFAIHRDPRAGYVENDHVYLHNGLKVPLAGPFAYYGSFSSILPINRGVHEPLEEYVFQEVLPFMPTAPVMLELGAYWGHYSMWMKKTHPGASVHMVEPELKNIDAGKSNFKLNGFTGEFTQAFVGKGYFAVDVYLAAKNIQKLDLLHSDIQGFELEMLDGAAKSLSAKCVDYVFVSTHSQTLHQGVVDKLKSFGYRVEVSSDFDFETTSYDGFIFASSPNVKPVFDGFSPLSRVEIADAKPGRFLEFLSSVAD